MSGILCSTDGATVNVDVHNFLPFFFFNFSEFYEFFFSFLLPLVGYRASARAGEVEPTSPASGEARPPRPPARLLGGHPNEQTERRKVQPLSPLSAMVLPTKGEHLFLRLQDTGAWIVCVH